MQLEALETVFQAGFYAGTCGEATTAQIKAFLHPNSMQIDVVIMW